MSVDLRTQYLGFFLRNPIVASAGPMTEDVDRLHRLEEAGVGAVVLPSLFQEQIEHDEHELHRLHLTGADSFSEATNYFPELDDYNTGPDAYLEHIAQAKAAVRVPVIASLNGLSRSGWEQFARLIEQAGADALELNIYFVPTDPEMSSADVEQQYVDLVAAVRQVVEIPLAVKIGPYFSAPLHLANRLAAAGADGLVVFNRYLQPDVNLETLQVTPQLALSTPLEQRLPLQWIGIMYGNVKASLAHTTGVHSADGVIKSLLVGADVAMMTSALLMCGADYVKRVIGGVEQWLEEHDYVSVEQMKGSLSRINCPDPKSYERMNYMRALTSYTQSQSHQIT